MRSRANPKFGVISGLEIPCSSRNFPAERRCARIPGNVTRQKRKGGRSHPSQTTIAEGQGGYRSSWPSIAAARAQVQQPGRARRFATLIRLTPCRRARLRVRETGYTGWGEPMPALRRRDFISLLGAVASSAAWPLAARAQQGGRGRRIVALMSMAADAPEAQPRVGAFESGLRELGWLDGRDLRIEYRWVASDGDLLRRNAAELARMPPDLILATSTPVMAALREQGLSVPIMFVQVTDPVGQGLVPNLARPGGHITGFINFEFSIGTKWLEMLKQIAPRVTRVALIYNPETAPHADLFQRPRPRLLPSPSCRSRSPSAQLPSSSARSMLSRARRPAGCWCCRTLQT